MEALTRSAEKQERTDAPDEVSAQLRKAQLLLNIYRRTASVESLDEMLHAIVEIASRETGAERGTLFLHDEQTGELYSRVAQGRLSRELRLPSTQGIAGEVFTSGRGVIVQDAYQSDHFDPSHDEQTGFVTRSVLCAPVRTLKGDVIGVIQTLNKERGDFTIDDLALLEEMAAQASDALRQTQLIERMRKTRAQELRFIEVVSDVTSELELEVLLKKVMEEASRMLDAERSTLFLNDDKTGELWSLVGEGLKERLRFPNHLGIAGAVFQSGKSIEIPYAYADLRFNPTFDRRSGFFTRSILCVPIVNRKGKVIGVTQALNKRGGAFTREDEARLRAFTAQVSIALENAKLFTDVQNIKNYNESILESMSSGVLTLDEEGKIVTCNAAGLRLLRVHAHDVLGKAVEEFFRGDNTWVLDTRRRVEESQAAEILMGADLAVPDGKLSVNVTVLPLMSIEKTRLGSMIMIEDMSTEKRMKSTMSLYMDPTIANQMLEGGADILGGKNALATILFSDIRDFTTVSEELGPQGTVRLLNDYFSVMVESIQREEGMLDKFIGDAMMAAFGLPISHGDDEDRAVRAAVSMIRDLDRWNAERAANGQRMVHMGIGINTDTVVAGNIGSPKRMNYTLIGDGVNLASRLEGLCKEYAARILITEHTRSRLRGTYRLREVDRVVVKGKTEPIAVHEVLDYHTDESFPELVEVVGHYINGLSEYRKRRWERALKSFREALRLNPEDRLSAIYVKRSELYLQNPPPDDWDGTFVMKTK